MADEQEDVVFAEDGAVEGEVIADDGADAAAEGDDDSDDGDGEYPLTVTYCKLCSLPLEYCEFGPHPEKCRAKALADNPELADQVGELAISDEPDKKKKQTRGGKGLPGKSKGKKEAAQQIVISKVVRNKRKHVTSVVGMKTFDIELKKASKMFASRFAASSSVVDDDEIHVQGDQTHDIVQFITTKWKMIKPEQIKIKS
eukprot:m.39257 g.39257  ORF g.39257 m.39257 type:complete len:200 (-) comp11256_c0_seq1:132-731(-)